MKRKENVAVVEKQSHITQVLLHMMLGLINMSVMNVMILWS